jgi:hypothetical protein
MDCFHDTGLPSNKVFMLPNKTKIKATKTMQLKHKLRAGAGKMNIIPNLHSTLISVPKMADHGCEDIPTYTESLCCDLAFAHKKEFSIFKFPERFLEVSCRDLTLSLIL